MLCYFVIMGIDALPRRYGISQSISDTSKTLDQNYGLSTKWANASSYIAATAQYATDVVNRVRE